MGFAAAMVVAMMADAALGWPKGLFVLVGHPVTWFGKLIDLLDAGWNRSSDPPAFRRAAGVAATLFVIALAAAVAWAIQALLLPAWSRIVLVGILAWPLVALRSLHDHVAAVAHPLRAGDLRLARTAVAQIVGRDPATLDEGGIARAAIESLAENASDGVVAPVFWGAIFGLPGIVGYKAVNTLDSMIGHRTSRHEAFGWAAARIDDVANFVPARLARDCERLDSEVKALGWTLVGGTPLFRLYETGDAQVAQERLARAHIWSRVFAQSPGWLRLGLPGNEAEWARLASALVR